MTNVKTYQHQQYNNQLYEARYYIRNANNLKELQAFKQLARAIISLRD